MKKYQIDISETIIYQVIVEAKNEEQVCEDFMSGNIDYVHKDNIIDTGNTEITKISIIKN